MREGWGEVVRKTFAILPRPPGEGWGEGIKAKRKK